MNDDHLKPALDALLEAAVKLWITARDGMLETDPREAARLQAALGAGGTHIVVTMALPSGGVRVGVAGEWQGERTLWTMVPDEPVLERVH